MSNSTSSSPALPARNVAAANRAGAFWNTMIGKKVVMAVTGVVLGAFVIGHMLGNLKRFSGPSEITLVQNRFLQSEIKESALL